MKQWYAVQTKPRQEHVARENLQRQDYTTYLPMIRQRKQRRQRWTQVSEPLFPRYLFIHADAGQQSLAPVRSTLGVIALVRFGQLLRPVPDAVIHYLRQAENAEAGERVDDSWPHRPGDPVQVLAGAFAGLTGIFQHPVGEERAILLLELLGRQTPIAIELDALGAT
ncbi:transcription/translation regulatory transformer protein RfaH [Haliea sp. E17]|uniref:transcription/translation regulatory transformer protein RfaH n=1 Tax=Haliea sp. E17 TaxID=3401576 RepID=UPI003AAA4BDE